MHFLAFFVNIHCEQVLLYISLSSPRILASHLCPSPVVDICFFCFFPPPPFMYTVLPPGYLQAINRSRASFSTSPPASSCPWGLFWRPQRRPCKEVCAGLQSSAAALAPPGEPPWAGGMLTCVSTWCAQPSACHRAGR